MQCVIENAMFLTKRKGQFVNKKTGEVERVYYKAVFSQDDSEPVELSIEENVFSVLTKLQSYDLVINISAWDRKFFLSVVDVLAPSSGVNIA